MAVLRHARTSGERLEDKTPPPYEALMGVPRQGTR